MYVLMFLFTEPLDASASSEDPLAGLPERLWAGRTRAMRVTVEDVEDEEDAANRRSDMQDSTGNDEDLFGPCEAEPEDELTAISMWDRLMEYVLREAQASGAQIKRIYANTG